MSRFFSFRSFMPLIACGLMFWLPACGDSPSTGDPAANKDTGANGGDAELAGAVTDALAKTVADGAEALETAADAVVDLVVPSTPAGAIDADQWGFAARLPGDTQLVLGLDNLSTHHDHLLASVFWQRASLLLEEAMAMAPEADGPGVIAEIRRYGGQSALIAFGDGWQPWIEILIKFDAINTRSSIQTMLAGAPDLDLAGAPDLDEPGGAPDPEVLAQYNAIIDAMEPLTLPPLTLAGKPTDPETAIERFWNDKTRAAMDERIVVGEFVLDGHSLVSLTTEIGTFLSEETRTGFLNLVEGETRETLSRAIDVLAGKKVELAFGMVDDHLVLFLGGDRSHFRLAKPGDSILANETFAKVAPWQDKLRFFWGYVTGDFQQQIWVEQPLLPAFDGLVAGFRGHERFSFVGEAIAPFRDRLAEREKQVFSKKFTDGASISWWDGGLHGEDFGGEDIHAITSDVPLKFLSVASRASNVFGMAFNGDPAYSAVVRDYLETWGSALYTGFQEAVRSGLFGEESAQQFAQFEEQVLPRLLEIYEGQRMMFQEGLGNQYGFLMDLKGRGPSNPFKEVIPMDFADVTFLRAASMYDVVDRDKVAEGWKQIGPTINRLVRDNPFFSSPVMLNPLSMKEGDMNLWFYPTPVFNDEFLLASAINDDMMIISTSRSLAADIRDNATPADGNPTAFFMKFDVRPVVEATHSWEKLALELEVSDADMIRNTFLVTREWLSPFQEISVRRWKDNSGWRGSWSMGLQDMVAFD